MNWTPEEKQKYIDELKASMEEQKRADKEPEEKQKREEEERREQGKRQAEKWLKKHPWVAVIILLVIIGAFAGPFWNMLFHGSSSETATETNTPTQVYSPPPVYIEIDAGRLQREYDNNEIAADLKYEGKFLKVHGIIKNIGESIWGTPYVVLVGEEGDWDGVKCSFPDDNSSRTQLARLNPGQEMTVTGKCEGCILGIVLLEHE